MTTPKTAGQIAAEIAAKYEPQLTRIRANTTITPEYKRARIAKLYLKQRAEQVAAIEAAEQAAAKGRADLEYKIFGSPSHHDDPSQVISRRDAADRAEQLETEQQAIDLIRRADRVRDETLARAVVERAFEYGWGHAINTFLETRQKLVPVAQQLWDVVGVSAAQDLNDGLAISFATCPEEVRGLSDLALEQLAHEAETAVATA